MGSVILDCFNGVFVMVVGWKIRIIRYSYGELRKNAKEYYSTIERIWCPTLNIFIVFDKTGFRHLMRQGNSQRPKRTKATLCLIGTSSENFAI